MVRISAQVNVAVRVDGRRPLGARALRVLLEIQNVRSKANDARLVECASVL